MQQTPDATPEEIKKAYYSCMKACHPDLSGNNPDSTDFCMFVNEIYEVLVLSYLISLMVSTILMQFKNLLEFDDMHYEYVV